MILFSIYMGVLGVLNILSTFFEWELFKKSWHKGKPYSNFDKIMSYIVSFIFVIISIFIFIKSY